MLLKEVDKELGEPCVDEEIESAPLLVTSLDVMAGFALTDPEDPRYQRAMAHRTRFGNVVHRAAVALRQDNEAEDHIDAVVGVSKAIDVYLLEYGMTRGSFDAYRKSYAQARKLVKRLSLILGLSADLALQFQSNVGSTEREYQNGLRQTGSSISCKQGLYARVVPTTISAR